MKTIHDVIKYFGSQTEVANKTGVSQTAIWKIVSGKTKRINPELAKAIHVASKGEIDKYDLRPDIFDPPVQNTEQSA